MTNNNKIQNRHKQIQSGNNKWINDIKIGLYDIDKAIHYYFTHYIKPIVKYSNEIIPVTIKYANAERWKQIQKNGYIRDKDGKIVLPLITYKKTSISKSDMLPINKMNALKPAFFKTINSIYTSKQPYDRFAQLQNQKPTQKIHKVVIPQYINIDYDFFIWAHFEEHLNTIIESINYHEGIYWGNDRYKFAISISDYSIDAGLSNGEDRYVKCTFTLQLKGYLLPDIFVKEHINQLAITINDIEIIPKIK